jgi:hypothetical protein
MRHGRPRPREIEVSHPVQCVSRPLRVYVPSRLHECLTSERPFLYISTMYVGDTSITIDLFDRLPTHSSSWTISHFRCPFSTTMLGLSVISAKCCGTEQQMRHMCLASLSMCAYSPPELPQICSFMPSIKFIRRRVCRHYPPLPPCPSCPLMTVHQSSS